MKTVLIQTGSKNTRVSNGRYCSSKGFVCRFFYGEGVCTLFNWNLLRGVSRHPIKCVKCKEAIKNSKEGVIV
jgi:hypothetical protein